MKINLYKPVFLVALLVIPDFVHATDPAAAKNQFKNNFVTSCTKGLMLASYRSDLRRSGKSPSEEAVAIVKQMTPAELRDMMVSGQGDQGAMIFDRLVQKCSCMAGKLYSPYPDAEFMSLDGQKRIEAQVNQKLLNRNDPERAEMMKSCI